MNLFFCGLRWVKKTGSHILQNRDSMKDIFSNYAIVPIYDDEWCQVQLLRILVYKKIFFGRLCQI